MIVVRRGVHDGGGAIGAGGVDVRALGGEQAQGGRVIAGFCGVEQRGVGGRRDRRCRPAGPQLQLRNFRVICTS